jgi:hypothetical protein
MSVEIIVSIVIAIASPAVAWVIQSRMFEAKTTEWREAVSDRLKRLEQTYSMSDLASFRAMDNRREMDWVNWRRDLEERFSVNVKGQADWRHNEYAPEARAQSRAIAGMQEQITALKERADRIERKVFNGSRSD